MIKELGWKVIFILAIAAVSVWMCLPLHEKINLGLDLKGGMHLVYRVEIEEAVRKQTDSAAVRLKSGLKDVGVTIDKAIRVEGTEDKIEVTGMKPTDEKTVRSYIEDYFKEWNTLYSETGVILTMYPKTVMDLKEQAIEQALETINNRVDQFGVAEPVFQRQGDDQLLIQLPGVSDKEKNRIMGLINSTALLEFKKVINRGPFPSEQEALKAVNGKLPEDQIIMKWGKGEYAGMYSILQAANVISGTDLKNSSRGQDGFGAPLVHFSLNNDGANRFLAFTAQNVGQALAIILDDRVITAPVIQDVLSYDSQITGIGTIEEADDLVVKLRSGALPARLTLLHQQIIGPSLGADSIRKGLISCIVGLTLVLIFMVFFYKWAGVNAVIALIFNLLILMGFMSLLKATLTLPGIAGIILTMGMSVDANVLIFERIKEDLKMGKSVKAAIESGFKKAFITIFDSNLTTVVAALFLIQFGTSSIKGFAITLIIGITASMFTAVWVSRVIFDLVYSKRKKLEKISI